MLNSGGKTNILTLVLSEKKFLNKTKYHTLQLIQYLEEAIVPGENH
jgi:hypothetical protein